MSAQAVGVPVPKEADPAPVQFRTIGWIEMFFGLTCTAVIVWLHYVAFAANPALWRDEVAAINLAQVSSLAEFWRLCEFDSSFFTWFVVLRGWIALAGDSDFSLRILGTGIGLLLLAGCWWTARQFECRSPLLILSLFALNSAVIFWGDTLRGYALGTLLMLLTMGTTWRFARDSSWKNLVLALIPAFLAVHTLYYNCIFLFAMCMGVTAVKLREREWSAIVRILGLGFVCAISMLIYVDPIRRVGLWRSIVETPLTVGGILGLFRETTAYLGYVDVVWFVLLAVTPLLLLYQATRRNGAEEAGSSRQAVYLLVTFAAGLTGVVRVQIWHGYPPQPWHFIPLLAFVSVPIEAAIDLAARSNKAVRQIVLFLIAGFWFVMYPGTREFVDLRRTNVDLAAAIIRQRAAPDDLVVVNPWGQGVTFGRYHLGPAEWRVWQFSLARSAGDG